MEDYKMDSIPANVQLRPGILKRLVLVFSEPGRLFPTLTGKMDWLVPFLIVAILGG
jgi:hypothetical protein